MEDLQTGDINLHPTFITRHLTDIKKQFDEFKRIVDDAYLELVSANQYLFDSYKFDSTGEAHTSVSSLSQNDLKLKQQIDDKFAPLKFFIVKNDYIYNRQEVYYCARKDNTRIYQAIYTLIYLDSILFIVEEMKSEEFTFGSFIISSILDDVRYKLILLYEDVLINEISLDRDRLEYLVKTAIVTYYSYLLHRPQTTISHTQLIKFAKNARDFITSEYLNRFDPTALKPIRGYKEGDLPNDNLLFIHKLKKNIPLNDIDVIIGIRFGGIELPYLINHFIYPDAKIKLERISNYSDNNSSDELALKLNELKNKNVLIVDDGITTGRTLHKLVHALKNHCNNIYFACIYYSGAKRIKHTQMDGHGGINFEQLKKFCVLKESNYTASRNKTSYTDANGKFDKTKAKIEAKTNFEPTLFDPDIPIERSIVKGEDAQKVFIACSMSYIEKHYDYLMFLRNKYQKHPGFEIVDDWLVNRMEKIGNKHQYREIPGRNFLGDAITDIFRSDIIIFFCPGPSAYLSALFIVAKMRDKKVIIFFSKQDDVKDFRSYSNSEFFAIKQIKTTFTL